tara:strand:+ start:294 stop:509 length:216 start_codon:yes stop_codon:yes gene_type:complete
MTELFTLSQKRILSTLKQEFVKMNMQLGLKVQEGMEPLSEEVYASLPEYEDHPSEYYDKLLDLCDERGRPL